LRGQGLLPPPGQDLHHEVRLPGRAHEHGVLLLSGHALALERVHEVLDPVVQPLGLDLAVVVVGPGDGLVLAGLEELVLLVLRPGLLLLAELILQLLLDGLARLVGFVLLGLELLLGGVVDLLALRPIGGTHEDLERRRRAFRGRHGWGQQTQTRQRGYEPHETPPSANLDILFSWRAWGDGKADPGGPSSGPAAWVEPTLRRARLRLPEELPRVVAHEPRKENATGEDPDDAEHAPRHHRC